jgi:hypothetical protein
MNAPLDTEQKSKLRALKRHAAILIGIMLLGVVWLAIAAWLGFEL